jgi:endonuclease YncB( thermonuclease family)
MSPAACRVAAVEAVVVLVDLYVRRAEFVDIIDGDTIHLRVDVGFETFRLIRARVDGIDTAELHGADAARGAHAREVTAGIMRAASSIMVQSHRKESYQTEDLRTFERYVVTVVVDGENLVDRLKAALTDVGGKWGETWGETRS